MTLIWVFTDGYLYRYKISLKDFGCTREPLGVGAFGEGKKDNCVELIFMISCEG